jgi:hypothetical protein
MPKIRHDIMNKDVVNLYEILRVKSDVARALDCSIRLVFEAIAGIRKDPLPESCKGEDMCTCCHQEPKAPGNRYLCSSCYEGADEGSLHENQCYLNDLRF